MGYTHYLKSDEALSAGQARACGEACMAFLALVPDAVLARALAHPGDLERRGLEEQAQANAAILERDVKGLRHFLRRRNLGFLCMPQDTESFAVRPDTDWMCCKTVDPGTEADSLVVCLHVASQEALREADRHVLRFEPDGCFEDLEAGLALWEDCTGAPAPHLPFVEGTRSSVNDNEILIHVLTKF
ncbi:MAG: hypothetical protein IK061_10180 [Desulfovibrio sp.]|nr:hypothetical protein [Desulfovibrio sp.]